MKETLEKAYDPKEVEGAIYTLWEENHCFQAEPTSDKPPYAITMPPPNVTGVLHMGHALVNTLQDILVRFKRMSGYDALWIPGFDHAGIATQTVVERHIYKEENKRRTDFTREDFLERIWEWKEQSQKTITEQLKCLGASCDWSRLRFTMDQQSSRAVRVLFKKLYDQGLIFRDYYLVNWDPVTQTALADDEVEYEERSHWLWYFNYPIEDSSEMIQIATTRPETMLGDTAVCVSPKDPRYTHLIGKTVLLPLVGRKIPIIADDYVDPTFGTGAVKITPAHDHNDYILGQRHSLPMINILTPDGKINSEGIDFEGYTIQQARECVIDAMQKEGFFIKKEPHTLRVGVSYRSKAVIEPYLSKQWYIRMAPFKQELIDIVREKETKIIPKQWEHTYFHWIENLRDWCISRQLWWGHQIPIWYNKKNPEEMIAYDGDDVPPEVAKNPDDWIQDPDVLDTWFSSALWPVTVLGWPDATIELERYYPNSALITGHDILFFWVARMIMMGSYTKQSTPFPEVFLNGLIYGKSYWREQDGASTYITGAEQKSYDLGTPIPKDVKSKWEKMSKTKGNIIDPIEMITLYGADAVRMALAFKVTEAPQIDLERRTFEEFRNFSNKIWNGARFVLMNLDGEDPLTVDQLMEGLQEDLFEVEDFWILERLEDTLKQNEKSLSSYSFSEAATNAYEFYWNDFCAWYVESTKPVLFTKRGSNLLRKNKQKLLLIVLLQAIRLLHPLAPFITETLFQKIKERFNGVKVNNRQDPLTQEASESLQSTACAVTKFPQVDLSTFSKRDSSGFSLMKTIISSLRNIRGEMKIPPGQAIEVSFIRYRASDSTWKSIQESSYLIEALMKIESIRFALEQTEKKPSSKIIIEGIELYVTFPQELIEQEKKRLEKEKLRLQESIDKIQVQLNNPDFLLRAPKELVEKQQSILNNAIENLHLSEHQLKKLSE